MFSFITGIGKALFFFKSKYTLVQPEKEKQFSVFFYGCFTSFSVWRKKITKVILTAVQIRGFM